MQMERLGRFRELCAKLNKHRFQGVLLAVDPGETTGLSVINTTPQMSEWGLIQGQIPSWPLEAFVAGVTPWFDTYKPTFLVHEAYHVYAWRLKEHSFSRVPTIQIIGALLCIAIQRGVPYIEQTAQVGKGFWTDEQLKRFGAFYTGQQHARDSLRHALQYIAFGAKKGT